MPWINVVANRDFGFQVSAEGGGYTWARNSRENALTPWANDPVTDRPGEAIYLRDEETRRVVDADAARRSATSTRTTRARTARLQPLRAALARHRARAGCMFVPLDDPIKISPAHACATIARGAQPFRHRLRRSGCWARRAARRAARVTEIDADTGALFARNPWNIAFPGVAFADLGGAQTEWTADRREFLGRHGSLDAPAALVVGAPLSGRSRRGLDACAALQTRARARAGAPPKSSSCSARPPTPTRRGRWITRYRERRPRRVARRGHATLERTLGHVQVKTPDRAFDLMLNGWLLYQTLACRTWARAGFYQASGAYGFRDQLQDAMALGLARPQLLREHILRAAARQFPEGDVQHWWLPHNGQGVRTHISDDRVWLRYVTAHYVALTGDRAILDDERAVPRRPAAAARASTTLLPARRQRRDRHAVRALPRAASTARSHWARTACR